ncbi:hypothetical protein [Kitasatospora kifunensis]|uniref:Uncharacterized protein n=1 Tax=Kitasatospora kifunensis TaxID=58351 RepID=A0A7W7R6S1_KITKI|nr:hypothetical protein [Kitasatospora kifunensis]MBB4926360.1 hypothetical protein [Kitasatospora kifunensis]
MTDTQVPLPVEPADLPLPRPVADAVLRGLLNGTVFDPLGAHQEGGWQFQQGMARPTVRDAVRQSGEQSGEQSGAEEETVRVAERERTAPAHCRYAMQYLD